MAEPVDVAALRTEYTRAGLREADLGSDPLVELQRWLEEAVAAGAAEPTAMVVATATPEGVPSARTVLLKGLDARGLVFYSNRHSAKGRELAANPRCALVFRWEVLQRQVTVSGQVHTVSDDESAAYFDRRPRASRIGAWASRQSRVVADRTVIDAWVAEAEARFGDGPIPLPPFWGGYRVVPERVEFWQGRPNRLHDRLRYRRDDGHWLLERLSP